MTTATTAPVTIDLGDLFAAALAEQAEAIYAFRMDAVKALYRDFFAGKTSYCWLADVDAAARDIMANAMPVELM